jgi:16S rRNA (guanine527-N7)-methyltransferase
LGHAVELLITGAAALGIPLDEAQQRQFARYYQELVEWNRRVNLTSVTEWEQVQAVHFLDSLTVALALPPAVIQGGRVLDVGSGGGFPGLPLKIAFPRLQVGLLESRGKKAAFLRHLAARLELGGVEVYQGRAEELARDPALREAFDAVLARGLEKMPVLAEITLPFARIGGILVAQKKGDIALELAEAQEALYSLGGGTPEVRWLQVPALPEARALVVVPKVAPTPEKYPRRPGMPAKRPLGYRASRPSLKQSA